MQLVTFQECYLPFSSRDYSDIQWIALGENRQETMYIYIYVPIKYGIDGAFRLKFSLKPTPLKPRFGIGSSGLPLMGFVTGDTPAPPRCCELLRETVPFENPQNHAVRAFLAQSLLPVGLTLRMDPQNGRPLPLEPTKHPYWLSPETLR